MGRIAAPVAGARCARSVAGPVALALGGWAPPSLLAEYAGRPVVALASGDPLVSGIATTLLDLFGAPVRVVPAVSSVALARARMGWSAESCEVVSRGRPDLERLVLAPAPGRRILVLSSDASTPALWPRCWPSSGWGAST